MINERENRFIDFVVALWASYPECYETNYGVWTENYDGEEGFFSIVLRTLIWNDPKSEKLYERIGGFMGVKKELSDTNSTKFQEWFRNEIEGIVIGGGERGAHRRPYHKKWTPRTVYEYLDLVKGGQLEFVKGKNFDQLYNKLKSIHGMGCLTAFDILQRLYRTSHSYISIYPERFYLTGGGVKRGLKKLYGDDLTKTELSKKGQSLADKIREKVDIPEDLFYFELETILCIYQKDKGNANSNGLLEDKIQPDRFAELYANEYCRNKVKGC